MPRSDNAYTLGFAAAVCVVCSILVSSAAVVLKARQEQNQQVDRQTQILKVAGLLEPAERLSVRQIQERFQQRIQPRLVDLAQGGYVEAGPVPSGYDPVQALKDAALSTAAPANPAGVLRLPKYAQVYLVMADGQLDQVILQVWGQGLWSTMYAYLALDRDLHTIRGLSFYQQAETPGLGGEVDNPRWKALWPGRQAFDAEGQPAIVMRKGGAGPPDQDPHGFDALSGATITSRGVMHLLNFWLGPAGYGPYLKQLQEAG